MKKKIDDPLQIPLLLQQREQEKQKEYEERAAQDIKEIEKDLTEEDLKQMKELDTLFGSRDTEEEDEEMYIKDPYARQQAILMKHQEYRIIKVGSTDLLMNG